MNYKILDKDVQDFIAKNINNNLSKLILSGSPFIDIDIKTLATQIEGKKKIQKKLPLWFTTFGIYYPSRISVEQCSSEKSAKFKASLVSGENLTDITGGFGVDSYYFSTTVKSVNYVEMQKPLMEITSHNFEQLRAKNILCNCKNGLDFLKNIEKKQDWIFADPARRDNQNKKVFRFADCQPNIPENIDLLFSKSDNILIKSSPLLDIKLGIEELGNVSDVYVVSIKNECKELLFILNNNCTKTTQIHAVELAKENIFHFEFTYNEESNCEVCYSIPQNYLYEPSVSLLKAGAFKTIANRSGVSKLHKSSHLYTSEELIKDFPGKSFRIKNSYPYHGLRSAKKDLPKQANIVCRNFPTKPENLHKKLKIKNGGLAFLFFTTNKEEELIILECEKVIK